MLLQVLDLVAVGSGQVGAHATVMAIDDDTAATGRLLLIIAVFDGQAGFGRALLERLGVLVLADATNVDDRVEREDVLGTASGVLSSTTVNELSITADEVLVDALVLLLGEDSGVALQAILVEQSLITVIC